ncbi:MAG: M48 family metallopeptidase [Anaerolineales bacterium]|nr:M48 family metallopeptidase [Anaerolineales bacterium]
MQSEQTPTIDQERQDRAREYARIRRRLMLLQLLGGAAYVLLWILLGWATDLRALLTSGASGGLLPFEPHWTLQVVLFTLGFGLPWSITTLPLSYYSGFVLPHRYDQSTQTLREWIWDGVKSTLISLVIGMPLLLGLYALLRTSGDAWWLWAAAGYTFFGVVLTSLAPVLLMPIFYELKPLADDRQDLAERLIDLAQQVGTRVEGVYKIDMSRRTKAANAALAGLGRTRRILLGDTLLENFTPDEIETILAHELGHHVHRDIPLGIAAQTVFNFVSFYIGALVLDRAVGTFGLQGVGDPAGLPALTLVLSIVGLVSMPITNHYSRWRESMADDFALRQTANPRAFASAMTRLANQNLAQIDPPRWVVLLLSSHPPLRDRIQKAEAYLKSVEAG